MIMVLNGMYLGREGGEFQGRKWSKVSFLDLDTRKVVELSVPEQLRIDVPDKTTGEFLLKAELRTYNGNLKIRCTDLKLKGKGD